MIKKRLVLFGLLLVGFPLLLMSCGGSEPAVVEDLVEIEQPPPKPLPGDMVLIPAGEFKMGTDTERDPPIEMPEHVVDLPAFYIDVYEVTHGEWIGFTTESDYVPQGTWRDFYNIGKEDYPVSNVTLEDARAFCEHVGKRLPTEAEWEKAARGPDSLKYSWGDVWDATKANTSETGMRNTQEVGQAVGDLNAYGLYDTVGNVQEWTSDELKPYPDSPARRHESFRKKFIAVRGSSYAMKGRTMPLYQRSGYAPDSQFGTGFRCARDAEQMAEEQSEGEDE